MVTGKLQFYTCYNHILMVAMVTLLKCYHENHTNGVQLVQSDAHNFIVPIVKNNNCKYYLWLIVVAMAIAMTTIVVDYT